MHATQSVLSCFVASGLRFSYHQTEKHELFSKGLLNNPAMSFKLQVASADFLKRLLGAFGQEADPTSPLQVLGACAPCSQGCLGAEGISQHCEPARLLAVGSGVKTQQDLFAQLRDAATMSIELLRVLRLIVVLGAMRSLCFCSSVSPTLASLAAGAKAVFVRPTKGSLDARSAMT